jgi:hypothetical protein
MIDPAGTVHNLGAATTMLSRASTRQPPQTQTFASALSGELDSQEKASALTPSPSCGQRASEGIVTRQDSGTGTSSSPPPQNPTQPQNPIEAMISAYDSGISAAPAGSTPAPASAPATATGDAQSTASFDQAYWASQPAAVQQLQSVNPADRPELATQLANEGYSIDVPIMVWGWDPAATMATRQADGYTWVPSALQQPVEVAPGLTFNGQSYNPANPPAGFITVT